MQQTSHYQLNQWDFEDQILMADFNSDNQKTDAALNTLAEQITKKANSSTVNSLTTKVNAKAEQSALTAAVNRITALESGTATEANLTALTNRVTALESGKVEESDHAADVAALRSENCWVKLSDKTLGAAASSYSWTITNPGNYAELRCVFELACTGEIHFNVQNGAAMKEVYKLGSSTTCTERQMLGGTAACAGGYIRLSPMGGSGNVLVRYELCAISDAAAFWAQNDYLGGVSQTYKNLSTVKIFSNDGNFSAGSRFKLYGLKK